MTRADKLEHQIEHCENCLPNVSVILGFALGEVDPGKWTGS